MVAVLVVVISVVVFLYLGPRPPSSEGEFTLTLELSELSMRIGDGTNIKVYINSTGYKGKVTMSEPNYSCLLGEIFYFDYDYYTGPPHYTWDVEKNATLINSFGFYVRLLPNATLEEETEIIFTVSAYGNYGEEDQFIVYSNPLLITILPGFTISIEPKDITVQIGEEGVVYITIKSTGYEGEVKLSPKWTGPIYEPLFIHPAEYNSSDRFLEKNGVLALKYTFEFHVYKGETYDHQTNWTHTIVVYGNYGTEREFMVVDSHTVTVLP